MDLSGLKWPVIILVIVAVGWLGTSGGINFMIKNFTKVPPGQDPARDVTDEAGLTKVGGYLMFMWRWDKAIEVMELSMDRYGQEGANFWYNLYRTAKCYEKLKGSGYQRSYDILGHLINNNASRMDERVPDNANLELRANKLKEVHELR